jgi:hypothetical protein
MKEAIDARQDAAAMFPVPSSASYIVADLMPHVVKHFGAYLDQNVTEIKLVQVPDTLYLEVTRKTKHGSPFKSLEESPLSGLWTPNNPTPRNLGKNEALVKSLDEYDWIVISDLFPADIAQQIATEWGGAGRETGKKETDIERAGLVAICRVLHVSRPFPEKPCPERSRRVGEASARR